MWWPGADQGRIWYGPGWQAVPPEAAVVVVHDAARPLSRPEIWEAVIEAVRRGADGAVPCVPVADTIKQRRR